MGGGRHDPVLVLTVLALAQFGRVPVLSTGLHGASAWSQQALQQDPEPTRWEGVPDDISLAVAMPSWAGCPRPPCKYGEMADGAVNASVSSQPPTARQGISG